MVDQGTHSVIHQQAIKSGAVSPGWKLAAFDDANWTFPTLADSPSVTTPGWPNAAAIKYDPPHDQAYYRRWMTPDYNGAGRMYLVAEVDTEVRVWLDGNLILEKPSGVTGIVEAEAWYSDVNPKQLAIAVFGGGSWAWDWRREWDGSGASIRRTYDPNVDSPVDPWIAQETVGASSWQSNDRPSQHWGPQLWHKTSCDTDGATPETPEKNPILWYNIQARAGATNTNWQLQTKWASLTALVKARHIQPIVLAGLQVNVGSYVESNLGVDRITPGLLDADVTNTRIYLDKTRLSVAVYLTTSDTTSTSTRLILTPVGASYSLLRPPGGTGVVVQPEPFKSGTIGIDHVLFAPTIDHVVGSPAYVWSVPCPEDEVELDTYVAYVWDGNKWNRAHSNRSISRRFNNEWQQVEVLA